MTAARMSRLERFVGIWNTSGEILETELGPATTLTATDVYRWLPGKHFIVHDVDARFGALPTRSMEVIGYDRASRKYWSRSYDDRGQSEQFELALNANKWTITGAAVRFSGRFSPDSDQLTGLWELKGGKRGWQPWIRLELIRA